MNTRAILLLLAAIVLVAPLHASVRRRAAAPPPPPAPLVASVVFAPQAVTGSDDRQHIAYELLLRNTGTSTIIVQSIEARTIAADPMLRLAGDELRHDLLVLPLRSDGTSDEIRSGEIAIAYLYVTRDAFAPELVTHRLTFAIDGHEQSIDTATTTISTQAPVRIASPLRGPRWIAYNGLDNDSSHRRALLPFSDGYQFSQRYAIDWAQFDLLGRTRNGPENKNSSYYAYGQDALAVADGTVIEVVDSLPENVPHQPPVIPITIETLGGNHILLDLGNGAVAYYAHLQPGSMRVRVGDRVTRGAALAKVGNSGNSSEPHLHFHICNAASGADCQGIPYVFDHFALHGGGKHQDELPLKDVLVDFD